MDEIREIFLAEAVQAIEELSMLFTDLEKNHESKKSINAIFRITHTLKANAAGMGFNDIASMAHLMEDIFSEIKNNKLELNTELFNDLFKANDIVAKMIAAISDPTIKVVFRGTRTKLDVILREARGLGIVVTDNVPAAPAAVATPEVLENKVSTIADAPALSMEDFNAAVESAHKAVSELPTTAVEIEESVVEEVEEEEVEEETKVTFSDNINIPLRKLDNLLNLVGELIIERDRVIAMSQVENFAGKSNDFARLSRITSEIQYSVMDVRLVQVNVLFSKFHRIVRDVANIENKKVQLLLEGTENEIDRNVLQIISDSLIHLVRNSVGHGIELEADRIKVGKNPMGTVILSAKNEKDAIIIDIIDDGKGIDPAIIKKIAVKKGVITQEIADKLSDNDAIMLIFEAGFSSAEQVTSVSGRGVGMDVVKKSLDSIGGIVTVHSEVGKGSTMRLRLPSSMAVKGALLFELGESQFAIPLAYTDAVVSLKKKEIHKVRGGLLATYLERNISIVFLKDLFVMDMNGGVSNTVDVSLHKSFDQLGDDDMIYVLVVSYNNHDMGFVVDKLLQQKEIVEKPLQSPLDQIKFISGATILGNGNVCLVLDTPSISNFLYKSTKLK
jgi:two-component system chemotaxis sensor kinase CheA